MQTDMKDILFGGGRKGRWLIVLGAALLVLPFVMLMRVDAVAQYIAPAAVYVPLGVFALWAAMDFDAAFVFFHEMLFTNDLWLLNPATDLLIRICPSSMFMAMGGRILLLGFVWAAFVPVAVRRATLRKGKENEGLRSADARES